MSVRNRLWAVIDTFHIAQSVFVIAFDILNGVCRVYVNCASFNLSQWNMPLKKFDSDQGRKEGLKSEIFSSTKTKMLFLQY